MLLVTALISIIVLCAAETKTMSLNPGEEVPLYRTARRVLRRAGHLHLLWYSNELNGRVTECLVSQFLNQTEFGAKRTLETNSKFEDPTNPDGSSKNSKLNITASVYNVSNYQYLVLEPHGGELTKGWDGPHDVLYANATPGCIVLQALLIPKRKIVCVMWGVRNSWQHCSHYVQEKCTEGQKVNLTDCEIKKKPKRSVPAC